MKQTKIFELVNTTTDKVLTTETFCENKSLDDLNDFYKSSCTDIRWRLAENQLMAPMEFENRMIAATRTTNPQSNGDYLMMELLRSLGYGDGVSVFLNIERNYE
jgi:hypothetical protein